MYIKKKKEKETLLLPDVLELDCGHGGLIYSAISLCARKYATGILISNRRRHSRALNRLAPLSIQCSLDMDRCIVQLLWRAWSHCWSIILKGISRTFHPDEGRETALWWAELIFLNFHPSSTIFSFFFFSFFLLFIFFFFFIGGIVFAKFTIPSRLLVNAKSK